MTDLARPAAPRRDDVVLSVPVTIGGSAQRPRFKLNSLDARFPDGEPKTTGKIAERVGEYSSAMIDALESSDHHPNSPALRDADGVVAWIHVTTEDERVSKRDRLTIDWTTDADPLPEDSDAVYWEVEYENPNGAVESTTFQGSWTLDWFTREYPGEILDVTTRDERGHPDHDDDRGELVTDGGEDVDGPVESDAIGDEVPAIPSEISTFEASVRRNMSGNWSLASDVWRLQDESSDSRLLVTFYHRDSISRIQLSTEPPWVDADVRVEVYQPLSKEDASQGPAEDVNDLTVTDKTFQMMGEAVWFAEYFARTVDDRIPENPATTPHGPVDQDDTDAEPDGGRLMTDGGEIPVPDRAPEHLDHITVEYQSSRADSRKTRSGTIRERSRTDDGDGWAVTFREDGDDGRNRMLHVEYYEQGGGNLWSVTRDRTTSLGAVHAITLDDDHVDLCPDCGRPYEEKADYPDRPTRYNHESEIHGSSLISFRSIEDSCTIADSEDDQ